ncbi:unnamed protein product [Phyllotreta striolata]|uniref:Uncharacterized protein n=1 Tax=Phyllotreta striolata TaxID=444603 RepID=A0A9N9XQN3_PHYSR|nr:unnamed protein product [Phyllotreta striolata]
MVGCKPVSFHIFEKTNSGDVISWTYPTVTDETKILIHQTCFSKGLETVDLFYYKREKKYWHYIKQFGKNGRRCAVIVLSECYKPDLYGKICDLFVGKCTGVAEVDFVVLVKTFLKIYVSDGISSGGEFVKLEDFPEQTNLKDIIKNLGIEFILLYNALLLKKQILVYHPNVEELQQSLNSITRLIPTQQPEDILEPYVQNISDLKRNVNNLLGTTNSSLMNQQNSFDLLVNLQTPSVEVTLKSKESFQLTSLHKDIANSITQLVEKDATELEIINEISNKTTEVLNYLKTFQSQKDVEGKIKNKNLQKFLTNLSTIV